MRILGISAFYHDSAAALVRRRRDRRRRPGGALHAQEARSGFPAAARSPTAWRSEAGSSATIDHVVFYDKPFLKFERLLETYLAFAPRASLLPHGDAGVDEGEAVPEATCLRKELKAHRAATSAGKTKLLFCRAPSSATPPAPSSLAVREAAVLTMDGVGEWATTSAAIGHGNDLQIIKEIHFPHSLGLLYSAFTYYTGFKVNSGEYKVMGLAPYGEPKYAEADPRPSDRSEGRRLVPAQHGLFRLLHRADHDQRAVRRAVRRAAAQARDRCSTQRAHGSGRLDPGGDRGDRAAAGAVARAARPGCSNLCLAGGVALNCVANGKVLRDGPFEEIWIQPAAGDAGGALGAALAAYHHAQAPARASRRNGRTRMQGAYLGPSFRAGRDRAAARQGSARTSRVIDDEALIDARRAGAGRRQRGRLVSRAAWSSARARSGARSILGDPRSPTMQKSAQPQGQIPRKLPALCAVGAARRRRRLVRARLRQPYMLLVARRAKQRAAAR